MDPVPVRQTLQQGEDNSLSRYFPSIMATNVGRLIGEISALSPEETAQIQELADLAEDLPKTTDIPKLVRAVQQLTQSGVRGVDDSNAFIVAFLTRIIELDPPTGRRWFEQLMFEPSAVLGERNTMLQFVLLGRLCALIDKDVLCGPIDSRWAESLFERQFVICATRPANGSAFMLAGFLTMRALVSDDSIDHTLSLDRALDRSLRILPEEFKELPFQRALLDFERFVEGNEERYANTLAVIKKNR